MNEWLAHLCNPQLKSQQLQDLKGYSATINHKALRVLDVFVNHLDPFTDVLPSHTLSPHIYVTQMKKTSAYNISYKSDNIC